MFVAATMMIMTNASTVQHEVGKLGVMFRNKSVRYGLLQVPYSAGGPYGGGDDALRRKQ